MKLKLLKSKAAVCLLVGCVCGGTYSAFAALRTPSDIASSVQERIAELPEPPDIDSAFKFDDEEIFRNFSGRDFNRGSGIRISMNFDKLVSEGIVDQATADSMTKFLEEYTPDEKSKIGAISKNGLFSEMVTAGVITQEQADAILAFYEQRMPGKSELPSGEKAEISISGHGLDYFVEQGIIDQDTADKMTAYMKEKLAAEKEKLDSMTREDILPDLKNKLGSFSVSSIFEDMAEAGIITQEQADAMAEVSPFRGFRIKTEEKSPATAEGMSV